MAGKYRAIEIPILDSATQGGTKKEAYEMIADASFRQPHPIPPAPDPAAKLGFWSAVALALLGAVLIAANVGIFATGQWPAWSGTADYANWLRGLRVNFWTVAFADAFLMLLAVAGVMAALHALAPRRKRVFGVLALAFTSVCIALEGVVYIVQLGPVRAGALAGRLDGLEPLIYHGPNSVLFAVDIAGFFFLGLATLCAAAMFGRSRVERAIFWLFVAFAIENVFGLLAQLAGNSPALAVYNVVMTLTLVASAPLLVAFFRRGSD